MSSRVKRKYFWLAGAVLLCMELLCCHSLGGTTPFADYDAYLVEPADDGNPGDVRWAQYLYNQLSNRTRRNEIVFQEEPQGDAVLTVRTALRPEAAHHYAVERKHDELYLTARDERTMVWLLHQFISTLGDDDLRFEALDLAPPMVPFDEDVRGDFPFEYRAIYSPSNATEEARALTLADNVDYDWGLWGHNAARLFADGKIPAAYMAVGADGSRSEEQVCLSSLLEPYAAYILEQYGPGKPGEGTRFMVMGLDSPEACQCATCRSHGNTPDSATGSALWLLRQLAQRFPHHQFFLGAYAAAYAPPEADDKQLPSNAGVMLSALSLPMRGDAQQTAAGQRFEAQLRQWQQLTPNIYVWDYMRNFDDYLTPYPFLTIAQKRLQRYRELGVKGLFFNGSGDHYATFDDLQTQVLSQLMLNPDINVEDAIFGYLRNFYPTSYQALLPFYMSAEHEAAAHGLPLYGGITESALSRTPWHCLEQQIHAIDSLSKHAEPEERQRLNRLLTALAFTELEMQRAGLAPQADSLTASERRALLADHTAFSDMRFYRETYGNISQYLHQWELFGSIVDNPLSSWKITPLTTLDEGAEKQLPALTDGRRAFPTDYHTGWLQNSSAELRLQLVPQSAEESPEGARVVVGMLAAPRWHILPPQTVELWQNGALLGSTEPQCGVAKVRDDPSEGTLGNIRVETVLSAHGFDPQQPFELHFKGLRPAARSFAIDEIALQP